MIFLTTIIELLFVMYYLGSIVFCFFFGRVTEQDYLVNWGVW